jgi:hypothetical protein
LSIRLEASISNSPSLYHAAGLNSKVEKRLNERVDIAFIGLNDVRLSESKTFLTDCKHFLEIYLSMINVAYTDPIVKQINDPCQSSYRIVIAFFNNGVFFFYFKGNNTGAETSILLPWLAD